MVADTITLSPLLAANEPSSGCQMPFSANSGDGVILSQTDHHGTIIRITTGNNIPCPERHQRMPTSSQNLTLVVYPPACCSPYPPPPSSTHSSFRSTPRATTLVPHCLSIPSKQTFSISTVHAPRTRPSSSREPNAGHGTVEDATDGERIYRVDRDLPTQISSLVAERQLRPRWPLAFPPRRRRPLRWHASMALPVCGLTGDSSRQPGGVWPAGPGRVVEGSYGA